MNLNLSRYNVAVLWFMMSMVCSVTNDVISRYAYMNSDIHSMQIVFLRCFFNIVTLIPIIIYRGTSCIKSSSIFIHFVRGFLFFLGILAWTYGLRYVQVPTATVISFSIPLFTLILAIFFLNEKITWQRWFVTIFGLIGVIITLYPNLNDINNYHGILFLVAALLFALLDVINKLFVVRETMVSMLFYSSLVICLLSVFPAVYFWVDIDSKMWFMFLIFGASANLILFFILKAFSLADATSIASYRYLELLMSVFASYIVFNEMLPTTTLYGAMIIIPSALFIAYSESKKS